MIKTCEFLISAYMICQFYDVGIKKHTLINSDLRM